MGRAVEMKSFKNWGRATMEFTKDHKLTHNQLSTLTEFCQWLAEEIEKKQFDPLSRENQIIITEFERINLFLKDKN